MLNQFEPIPVWDGTEREAARSIGDRLEREGWFVQYEAPLGPALRVDLWANDDRTGLVIEVKNRTAGRRAVEQLERYVEVVRASGIELDILGILAAPRLAATVKELPDGIVFQPLRSRDYGG